MTSYLASLTSHYNSIKRLLPNSLSADSDLSCTDPEDSHVSRVLRAYYTEKGRVFPPWLGPDPRAPEKAQPAMVSQSRYGQPQEGDDDGFRRPRSAATPGALDDLFGNGPPATGPPPPGRDGPMRGPRGRLNQAPPPRERAPSPTARPLPSQRHGSNQNPRSFGGGFGDDRDGGGGAAPSREQTAAERLKARLGGARSTTPEASSGGYDRGGGGRSGGNAYDGGGSNPYDSGRSGGRSNPYQSSSARNPYDSGGSDRYGGGSKPYTAASAPWDSGDGYGGGGGGGGGGYGRRAGGGGGGPGLPSNPRRR